MAADAIDDAWQETCFIAIAREDSASSDLQFAALTSSVNITMGSKDFQSVPMINGARIVQLLPEGDTRITFEAYPLQAGTDAGSAGIGWFDLMHEIDSSVPIRILNENTVGGAVRNRHRILVMWTNDFAATTAQQTTAANASAIRFGMAQAFITDIDVRFTDGIQVWTITAKCPAFDDSTTPNANVMWESCAGSEVGDVLPAVGDYTSGNPGNKFA